MRKTTNALLLGFLGCPRNKELKSICREFGLCEAPVPISLSEGVDSKTILIISDDYAGFCSEGLMDGSRQFSDALAQVLNKSMTLSNPIFLFRTRIPVTTASRYTPLQDLIISSEQMKKCRFSEIDTSTPLPMNCIFEISKE